jgi:hypothetical protein
MINEKPKVFICHASEDKERFVLGFAENLRANGVDAWLDKWEIKLGDSLVGKVFDEGIEECQCFIIILSEKSVKKKWVREELNSAFVQKIEKDTKIMPIIIDKNVNVPKVLKHTYWIKMENLIEYEDKLNEVLAAIFEKDMPSKPPLGQPPSYTNEEKFVNGLNKIDSSILKIIGDIIYEKNDMPLILNFSDIINEANAKKIPKEDTIESLEILGSVGYINVQMHGGKKEDYLLLTNFLGFYTYCETYIDDFEQILKGTASSILNEEIMENQEIAKKIGCKLLIIAAIFEFWELMGYVKLIKSGGNISMSILGITAEGNRFLKSLLT